MLFLLLTWLISKNMLSKSLFMLLLTLSMSFAYGASLAEKERVDRGRDQFKKFVNTGRNLAEDEYFLVSLATAIRPQDFDRLRNEYDMRPLSIHFCTMKGVLTIGATASESAVGRVARADLLSAMGGGNRYISPVELGEDLIPNDPKLCGFEARMSSDLVRRFHLEQDANILSIEIRDMKRRFFAVNHNLRNNDD